MLNATAAGRLSRQVFLLTCLATSTPLTALAAAIVCPPQAIRVAFDNRGHNYYQGKGFDLDLAQELGRRSGCRVSVSEMPRPRIFAGIEQGTVDMAFFAIQTPERERYAWFAPYMKQKNFVLMPPDIAKRYPQMQDFNQDKQAVFGVIRGFTHGAAYEEFLARMRAAGRVYEVTSTDQLLRMVAAGRVQAVFSLPAVYGMYIHTIVPEAHSLASLDWDVGSPAPPHQVMFSRKTFSAPAIQPWQQLVKDMLKDGTVNKLLARYLDGVDLERSKLL
jgi:polar amino acid transport system substrate-binding protein